MLNTDWIKVAQKQKSLGKSVGTLLVAAIISMVTTVILHYVGTSGVAHPVLSILVRMPIWQAAVLPFVLVFLGGLFLGWVYALLMKNLGGKGAYFEGLTTFAYPALGLAIGGLLASVVTYPVALAAGSLGASIVYVHGVATAIGLILFMIFAVPAFAGVYKATKDFFGVTEVGAFIALGLLALVFATGVATTYYGSTMALSISNVIPGLSVVGV